jgi:hypothetical protein
MSDQGLLELFEDGIDIGPGVYRLLTAPHTIMKYSQDGEYDAPDASEANALSLLFAKTNISASRVRRVVGTRWATSSSWILSKARL